MSIERQTMAARQRADAIRASADEMWALLLEAHEEKDWSALGYDSFGAYVEGEFAMNRGHAYRLIDRGRVIRELEAAAPGSEPEEVVTGRAAEEIKGQASKLAKAVKRAVKRGIDPQEAVANAVSRARDTQEEKASPPRDSGSFRVTHRPKREPIDATSHESRPSQLSLFDQKPASVLEGLDAEQRLAVVRKARRWVDRLEAEAKGYTEGQMTRPAGTDVSPKDCKHPVNSRLGDMCAICGSKAGGKR